jgi:hypothetical protein
MNEPAGTAIDVARLSSLPFGGLGRLFLPVQLEKQERWIHKA